MVQNSSFSRNVIAGSINEIETSLMPTEIYYEYLHENALESFGIILTTCGSNKAQTAVKKWSYGSSYGESTGSKSSGRLSICYLDYGKRKAERNDEKAGECFYNILGANQSPSGNSDEYLSVFNPSSGISTAQPYCCCECYLPHFKPTQPKDGKCVSYEVGRGESCSIIASKHYPLTVEEIEGFKKNVYGSKSYDSLFHGTTICLTDGIPFNCDKVSSSMLVGHLADTDKISSDVTKVIDSLLYFKGEIDNSPDKPVIYYKQDNVVGYVWIGQKVGNVDFPLYDLSNEVSAYGVPHLFHYSYIVSDPTKSFGIVINSKGEERI